MLNVILDDFKNSEFYEMMFNDAPNEIIAIFLGGSYLNRTADERSDLDIMGIVKGDNIWTDNKNYLVWKDLIVAHWNWRSIDQYYSEDAPMYDLLGQSMLKNITEDDFIYINEKYRSEVLTLINDKDNISKVGQIRVVKFFKKLINEIITDGFIAEKNYSKILYHLCLVYYYQNNLEPNLDLIREIKRIKWQPVQQKHLDQCFEMIKWLKENILDKVE